MGAMRPGPLSDLRVLDFTHHIAGPFCTKLLADFGAEVIKVERPGGGDPTRRFGPFPDDIPHPEKSGTFLYLNTNKLGISLDLKSKVGHAIALRLARDADVVVENYRPGVMSEFGLDYEILRKENPRLVMVSISSFGQTGPYRNYRATEIVAHATGGLMYITGLNKREPLRQGQPQAQYWAGTTGAAAVLTGVMKASRTGIGDYADVSIMECVASGLQGTVTMYSFMGAERRRQERDLGGERYILPCEDGYIIPMVGSSGSWEEMANCLDIPELTDPKFATEVGRHENAVELNQVMLEGFKHHGKHELFHKAQEWGFPFGLVQTPKDLANCPQLAAREYWTTMEHPVAGVLNYPGRPCDMPETPWQMRSAAPTLGQHNAEVYCGRLGYSKDELGIMARAGVI